MNPVEEMLAQAPYLRLDAELTVELLTRALREEVGKTVANPAEVDEEIRHLMDVFARR